MLRTGAERAFDAGFSGLAGKRVGLLCNPTALVRAERAPFIRRYLPDLMREAGVDVVRLYGPEHGIWATAQDMVAVAGGTDPVFGLPVDSLYGHDEDSLTLRPDALDGVDVLVFDVQDVGARYYTYAATLCMALDACAQSSVEVVVFDRPNPIGGEAVEGNAVGAGFRSFVGWLDVPQRHGLTVGELARLYRAEAGINVELTVIACEGWDPAMYADEPRAGGRVWSAPSPNMPTVDTAVLYPGGCLIEATSFSEGRGTTRPFELIGAVGVDARALAAAIDDEGIPGWSARPMRFEPQHQKHRGRVCDGVQLEVVDRASFEPVRAGVALLRAMMHACPETFGWRAEAYEFVDQIPAIDLLMGSARCREALEAGGSVDEACADFADAMVRYPDRLDGLLAYRRVRGPLAGLAVAREDLA